MIGTSSLSMPWAIEQAGLILGIGTILFMCTLCCYTALLIADLTFKFGESDLTSVLNEFIDKV